MPEPRERETSQRPRPKRKNSKDAKTVSDFVISSDGKVIEYLAEGPDDIGDELTRDAGKER